MIKVEHVSMRFRMNHDKVQSLKEFAVAAAKHRLKYKDFWVFQDVSFTVEKGEVVGIIGRNGAGKSTLLKIISGILTPTAGRVELAGKVVPMLELGSGFDYELTGRENIFLNGAILGCSEAFLKDKYDEIVEFSELGDFIETPIRNYSSGMMMRLAFSIATIVQPEILIVDEILAVGDEAFQKKSKRKMLELMGGGTTVLFVSHSIAQIREMCSRVVWLENGRIKMEGGAKYICDKYQEYLNPGSEDSGKKRRASDAMRNLSDVLFIYGDDEDAYEWRVLNQREQLLAGAVPTNEIYYKDVLEDVAKLYRVFIFVRCENIPLLHRLIKYAKSLHKKILFDFSYCSSRVQEPDPQEQLFAQMHGFCDGIIASNQALASWYRQKGYPVFMNPAAIREQIVEYASWAVYDRDVLPYCDADALSEDELINYNRAVLEKKKHKEEGRRIGFFSGTLNSQEWKLIEPVVVSLLEKDAKIQLYVQDASEYLTIQMRKYTQQIVFISGEGGEDILRNYAAMDIVLLAAYGEKQEDRLLQSWILAAFVKIPCFCIVDRLRHIPQGLEHGEHIWICQETKQAEAVLGQFILDEELLRRIGENAYAYAKIRHSSVFTGNRIGCFVRKSMQKNIAFLVSAYEMGGIGQAALHHAAVMSGQGCDVTILVTGKKQENMEYDGAALPVVSRDLIYCYQYFDTMASFDWSSTLWMQNYTNVGRRIYLVGGYEPDYYKPGNVARLKANQMYLPHTKIEFAAVCEWCRHWLKENYGQNALRIHNGIAYDRLHRGCSKFEPGTKAKILILGGCGIAAENLKEAAAIVRQLDRQSYDICFGIYGELQAEEYFYQDIYAGRLQAEKHWYQDVYVCRSQDEIWKMYQECSILLETSYKISYRTAPLAMMAAGGIAMVMRDEANAEYLEDGVNCVMYPPGDYAAAVQCIQKLSADEAYRKRLIVNGMQTAQRYDWKYFDQEITELYMPNRSRHE